MIQLDSLDSFVKRYWSHPFWENVEQPWIRISFFASKELLRQLADQGKEVSVIDSFKSSTHVVKFTRDDWESRRLSKFVDKVNRKAMHSYYYVNVIPEGLTKAHPSTGDVTNILFIPVDHDFKLPCGIVELYQSAGLTPWMVVNTSRISKGFKKYQVLLGLQVDSSRLMDRALRVGRLAAKVLGGDPAICDRVRILRLPGTRNWKDAETGKNRGFAVFEQLPKIWRESTLYSLSELSRKLKRFGETELSAELQELAPRRRVDVGEKASREKLFSVGWRAALESCRDGDVVAQKGERHNAMISWAGGLAAEVHRGRMDLGGAEEVLSELAFGACEGGFGSRDEGEEKELRNAKVYLSSCIKRDEETLRIEMDALLGEPLPSSEQITKSINSAHINGSGGATPASALVRHGDRVITDAIQMAVFKMLSGDPDRLKKFLKRFVKVWKEYKVSTGLAGKVTDVLLDRTVEVEMLSRLGFCVPLLDLSVWESTVKVLSVVGGSGFEQIFERLLNSVVEVVRKNKLHLDKQARRELRRIKEELSEKTKDTQVASSGSSWGSRSALTKRSKERRQGAKASAAGRVKKLAQLDYSAADRRNIVYGSSAVAAQYTRQLANPIGVDSAVYMQNGKFDLSLQTFIPGDFRLDTLSTTHFKFEDSLWNQCRPQILSSSGATIDARGFQEVLGAQCPRFLELLMALHPEDVSTWVLLLGVFGYCFTPRNPFQVMFNFHGPRLAGKSTVAEMITYLLGEHAVTSSTFEKLVADKEGAVEYFGKTIVYIDEAEAGDAFQLRKVETKLKAILGGGKSKERALYRSAIEAEIFSKFILTTNEILPFADTSGAMARRLVVLRFNNPAQIDGMRPGWNREILSSEADAIGTLAVGVLGTLWGRGRSMFELPGSKARSEGRSDYEEISQPAKEGFERFFEVTGDSGHAVPLSSVLLLLGRWGEETGNSVLVDFCDRRLQLVYSEFELLIAGKGGKVGVQRGKTDTRGQLFREGKNRKFAVLWGVRFRRSEVKEFLGSKGWLVFVKESPDYAWFKTKESESWICAC